MKKINLLLIVICSILVGCATNSGVVSLGRDTYLVSRQGSGFWVMPTTLRNEALAEANQYCINQNKNFKLVRSEMLTQIPLGQPGGPRFPAAEIHFKCVDTDNPELNQPSNNNHDTTLHITSKYDDFLNCVVIVRNSDSIGSGFFVSDDGYLITNNHVVGKDTMVSVRLRNGRTIMGDVLAIDLDRDLALIKVDGKSFSWLSIGELTDAGIGNDVLAIGTPEGLDWSISKGIVSAIRTHDDIVIIQTDAPINHGNSGGPLISLKNGTVIGINTFGFRKDITEGLNFAVSAQEIIKAFPQIKKKMPNKSVE